MTRIRLSVTAIAVTSLGLLFAPACSSDDTSEGGEGGTTDTPTTNQGGNKPQTGGTTGNGGTNSNGGTKASGGTVAAVGGAATGGKAAIGGSGGGGAGIPNTGGQSNTAGKPGTAGTTSGIGGVTTAGNAGQAAAQAGNANGGTAVAGNGNTGGANTAGTKNTAGTAGKTNTNVAGHAGNWTAGDCPTEQTSMAKFCKPENNIPIPNVPTGTKVDGLAVSTSSGVLTLSGNVSSSGWSFSMPPFNDAACTNAGVDATGKAGITVTVENHENAPVQVKLLVTDQAGTAAPYSLVSLSATKTIAASSTSVVNLPFSTFVAACTLPTGVDLNYATIRQIGLELPTPGPVNVSLSNISFYTN